MKTHLFLGIAAFALVGSLPAYAQQYSYSGKDGDALLRDSQRSESRTAPTVTQARQQDASDAEAARISRIEPAAGGDNRFADFTGPYAGLEAGYSMGSFDVDNPAGPDGDVALDGFNGGVFVGFGFEHNFVWLGGYAGIEAAYNWSGADGDITGASFEKKDSWSVTFRPGISMHQDALGYGIVGYSRTDFEGAGSDEDISGLVLGAGAQFDTNTPFKTRLEYTYTNFEDDNIGGVSFDGHENNIKLGAVFQF